MKLEAIRMFILTYNENKLEGRQFLQDHDSLSDCNRLPDPTGTRFL